ncbi:MAG: pilus assembly protein PilM [Candidatus Kaiserbacteria bacterium]|nr:pilus assembly protein PilM [Candidatus Kaiserbacteria bacterium]
MPLPKILSFFTAGKRNVVGIDIGSSAVKVVQVRQEKGVAVLETYGSLAIGPYVEGAEIGQYANANEEVLHTVLSALLQEAKVTASLACVSIPFHSSLISLIEVPALSDEKIAQTIPFEAKRYIPVPLEDVSLDWFVVPQALLSRDDAPIFEDENMPVTQEEKRKVLLIAIHNHELIKHKNILGKTDLNTKYFEIEIFSTLRSSVYDGGLPVIVVDIGARSTKLYVVEHGIILRSFFINQGGQNISQAIARAENMSFKEAEHKKREFGFTVEDKGTRHAMALIIDEIFTEANNAIVDFEQRYHQSISKIVLTGGSASMKGLLKEVETKTKISVEIANPFARLRHPALLSETLKETGSEFSVAVGAALRALEG